MLASLRQLRGLHADASASEVLDGTLIRRIGRDWFDPARVAWNRRVETPEASAVLELPARAVPEPLPEGAQLESLADGRVRLRLPAGHPLLVPVHRVSDVGAASQLPDGFDPGRLYASRNHPRGLQMAIYAASDALGSLGVDWSAVLERVAVDQVSVYASSAMGQLDDPGTGGLLKARSNGQRPTSKYLALGLAEMPADFINAYVLGSLGATGGGLGACASFLYNLRQAVHDIRSGRARVALVGASEAPVTPEVIEGYAAMGALATDKGLRQLDGLAPHAEPDHRRACRPFGDNCGFTVAESAQVLVLFDDALALELGAHIHGAVADVFVNADGYKKSISGPGVGNYITVAKALATLRAILGEQAVRRGSLVQAHGTGTPQNRTTESQILSRCAGAFGIENWPVLALKSHLGHSLAAASADQIVTTLGVWAHGLAPGVLTTTELADDVCREHLDFVLQHRKLEAGAQQCAVINAKGFGGNNASGALLSPVATRAMLRARHGEAAFGAWQRAHEPVRVASEDYESRARRGEAYVTYRFDHQVLGDAHVRIDHDAMQVGSARIALDLPSPFPDMRGGET
jgi:acetoacetyl-[acyl-carrier protein] synthase